MLHPLLFPRGPTSKLRPSEPTNGRLSTMACAAAACTGATSITSRNLPLTPRVRRRVGPTRANQLTARVRPWSQESRQDFFSNPLSTENPAECSPKSEPVTGRSYLQWNHKEHKDHEGRGSLWVFFVFFVSFVVDFFLHLPALLQVPL